MPRKPKLIKNPNEALNAPVNPTGEGEDPAVRDLLTKLPTATNLEALDIAMALQQIIRGQNSLLANQETQGREIAALRQRMAEMDQAAEKYDTDQRKFIEDVLSKAPRATDSEKDKLIAQGSQMFTEAVSKARASIAHDRLRFEEELAHMEQELVMSPGVPQMVNMNGHIEIKVFPEEVRIKHKVWRLPPGQPTMVPQVVAETLRNRRVSQMETAERQAALQRNLEKPDLDAEMARINTKYHATGGIVGPEG